MPGLIAFKFWNESIVSQEVNHFLEMDNISVDEITSVWKSRKALEIRKHFAEQRILVGGQSLQAHHHQLPTDIQLDHL